MAGGVGGQQGALWGLCCWASLGSRGAGEHAGLGSDSGPEEVTLEGSTGHEHGTGWGQGLQGGAAQRKSVSWLSWLTREVSVLAVGSLDAVGRGWVGE